ncbi:MerR family transcriptional regulator [Streptococcus porcinus]|uniref:MerR family transcriptional regulator n=1 Tax=Streptococcus porcinus TaxID=1340 RepID=A0A7V9WT08_STRPO|nr:MerR family transcriptional regulator [Streptococcus porcinus]MBA2796328.1 MerR family transcriptional regulator [Streptococcus porcinus]
MLETFSTGQVAKHLGVSVRTIQYYDKRDLLKPSEITEAGRRLYNQADIDMLSLVCYLRELDFSINSIKSILTEETNQELLDVLIREHIVSLKNDIAKKQTTLDSCVNLLKNIQSDQKESVDYLLGISRVMRNQEKWKQMQQGMTGFLLSFCLTYGLMLYLAVHYNLKWLLWAGMALFLGSVSGLVFYYKKKVSYLCIHCQKTFDPSFKDFQLAKQSPRTRKVKCPYCHKTSHCLEILKN